MKVLLISLIPNWSNPMVAAEFQHDRFPRVFCKTACWLAVGGFAATSAFFAWSMHLFFAEAARPGSLMCGNSVTDPLEAILSIGTPISVGGVWGFACLARERVVSWKSVFVAGLLTFCCTAGLLVFGFRFYRDALPGFHLSEIVWWLKPFGV